MNLLIANSVTSIGLDSFKYLRGIHDVVPSIHSARRSHPLVVTTRLRIFDGSVIHPLDDGSTPSDFLKSTIPLNNVCEWSSSSTWLCRFSMILFAVYFE